MHPLLCKKLESHLRESHGYNTLYRTDIEPVGKSCGGVKWMHSVYSGGKMNPKCHMLKEIPEQDPDLELGQTLAEKGLDPAQLQCTESYLYDSHLKLRLKEVHLQTTQILLSQALFHS